MKVDVVVPTMNEDYLPFCVREIRRNVDVNHVILVAPEECKKSIEKYGDIVICFNERNIGKARGEGFKAVDTHVYASIDSDVLVTREWFEWASNTIRREDVGACQGYAKPLGKYTGRIQENWIRFEGGMYGKGFCCLGNTFLKTDLVGKLGMPPLLFGEDWALRFRMEKAGYVWISNLDIVNVHVQTDVDVFKHTFRWISRNPDRTSLKDLAEGFLVLGSKGWFKHSFNENLFLIANNISKFLGYLQGRLRNGSF